MQRHRRLSTGFLTASLVVSALASVAVTPAGGSTQQVAASAVVSLPCAGSTPVVSGGRVFVTTSAVSLVYKPGSCETSALFAFDESGTPLWHHHFSEAARVVFASEPVVGAGLVAVNLGFSGSGDVYAGQLRAFSPTTGTHLWSDQFDGSSGPVTFADGTFFTTAQFANGCCQEGDWVAGVRADRTKPDLVDDAPGPSPSNPLVPVATGRGSAFVAERSPSPLKVGAFDETGTLGCQPTTIILAQVLACDPAWSAAVPGSELTSVAVSGGNLIATSYDDSSGAGIITGFNANGCESAICSPLWRGSLPHITWPQIATSPAAVFASSGNSLVAFSSSGCASQPCRPTWSAASASRLGPPMVSGSLVLVGTRSGSVLGFPVAGCGTATCQPMFRLSVGAPVTTAPAVADGRVFVANAHGHLMIFPLPSP